MLSADEVAKVVREVSGRILEGVQRGSLEPGGLQIAEIINETLYFEQERLREAEAEDGDGHEDAIADREFYADIRRQLPRASEAEQARMLARIVHRYLDEIAGDFNPAVYKIATQVGPPMLSALLTGLSPKRLLGGEGIPRLDQHVVVEGDVENLARLHERGTLIVAPTHSSNLDPLLLGLAIADLGLPPLTFGAGLSLFRNPVVGHFMHKLGVYTVDGRKRDPLYRRTLEQYATVSLEFGQDKLLFPGGTRSRSGTIERALEQGLLGSSLAAYRNNLLRRRPKPDVFIIPCTISYPLVLEASTLIEDWLAEAGESRLIMADDEFSRWERLLDFLRGVFSLDLKIHLRFGQALDPFGNHVDPAGNSLDPRGRRIEPRGYLEVGGEIVEDPVRDAEYTRLLERQLLREYAAENVIHATHALAFVCFERFRQSRPELDLYRLLATIGPDQSLGLDEIEADLEVVLAELARLSRDGRIRLSEVVQAAAFDGQIRALIRTGLRSFGTYHTRPVVERRGVGLHVHDAKLLLYYRNRLDGYGLGSGLG